jgi:hypothetical protein
MAQRDTVLNRVWDIATLDWERMQQPVIEGGTLSINPGTLATSAKQDISNAHLANLVGLEIPAHDAISLSYTGSNLTGVVYKTGGLGGTTVATLTLSYTGSTLTAVVKT